MRTLAAFLFAALSACTGQMQYTATVEGPDLVEVSPGVQVVADYDESVFFSDGFYWRYYGDTWYRSNNYAGGWVYWESPPVAVTRIRSPGAFTHYRPSGYVARHREYRRPEPIQRRADPVVRDHREEPRHEEPRREERHDAPVVRDHREEPRHEEPRHEERHDGPVVRDHRDDDKKDKHDKH